VMIDNGAGVTVNVADSETESEGLEEHVSV
jgi:hypothetical protein